MSSGERDEEAERKKDDDKTIHSTSIHLAAISSWSLLYFRVFAFNVLPSLYCGSFCFQKAAVINYSAVRLCVCVALREVAYMVSL